MQIAIVVSLFDKDGKEISNENIKLTVNNIALDFRVKQELYYTTTTTYYTENIPINDVYKFEITLTNDTSYFLGSVTPLAENSEKNIVCDEKGVFDKDFTIYWNNL